MLTRNSSIENRNSLQAQYDEKQTIKVKEAQKTYFPVIRKNTEVTPVLLLNVSKSASDISSLSARIPKTRAMKQYIIRKPQIIRKEPKKL